MTDQLKPLATTKAVITHSTYQTIITSGKHSVIADEPESAGGLDTGPSPSELLLASLASCTAITLQMYINRKMWVVKEITINLELFAVDNGTLIKSSISYKGEINEEQRQRLEQIADLCPIHKILTGNVMIDTVINK